MKNKLSSLLILVLVLTACDPNVAFYPEWIGEYSVKSDRLIYSDGDCQERLIEEGLVRVTTSEGYVDEYERTYEEYPPISIFNDKGLYALIPFVGYPFNPEVDPTTHVLFARSPKRNNLRNDSTIENVTLDERPHVVIIDGVVYTIKDSHAILPKPIKVLRASADSLILKPDERFEAILPDISGEVLGTVHAYWEYGPIKKEQDLYTFDAVLYVDPDSLVRPEIYRWHFTFKKDSPN